MVERVVASAYPGDEVVHGMQRRAETTVSWLGGLNGLGDKLGKRGCRELHEEG